MSTDTKCGVCYIDECEDSTSGPLVDLGCKCTNKLCLKCFNKMAYHANRDLFRSNLSFVNTHNLQGIRCPFCRSIVSVATCNQWVQIDLIHEEVIREEYAIPHTNYNDTLVRSVVDNIASAYLMSISIHRRLWDV